MLIEWFLTVNETGIFNINVGKHKETTEPSTLWLIQVVILQLHKERRAVLLMLIKRYKLQVWLQQKLKWKRSYKTWMFKYKAEKQSDRRLGSGHIYLLCTSLVEWLALVCSWRQQ